MIFLKICLSPKFLPPVICLLTLFGGTKATTQVAEEEKTDPTVLTLDRIYGKSEFGSKSFGGHWLSDESAYVVLEDSKQTSGAKDIVKYAAATGEKSVLVPGSLFIFDAESEPLRIEEFSFSQDMSLVLIYTNSKRVWRKKSRGDYWILDRSSRTLRKIAEHAKPSTTQFAKISPDSAKVAYVVDGNIFVEDVYSGLTKQLTEKPSDKIINGTFDWVYEEEFRLRDGYRWSPDSQYIAYWQIDTTDVPVFSMINNTDSMYPKLIQFAHPKTGQRNSACRIGVVPSGTGVTTWIAVPGDSRDNYIAKMDWVENPQQIVLQQLNRLQNTNHVMLANVDGSVLTVLTETDEAWVDVHNEMYWIDHGKAFTWISERDGWRHVYIVSRDGSKVRRATPGPFDAINLLHVNEDEQSLCFIASPENATQRYLYRSNFDGSNVKRLTPQEHVGSNFYRISSDGKLAIHTYSTADSVPITDLISLPDHKVVRTLEDNKKLRDKIQWLEKSTVEFFQVDIGQDVKLDGWCIKPAKFKLNNKYPLLVHVYGEPAGSTVVDRWGGSGYLWHLMMAQKGYVIMSFDNRGTNAPRGRAWRKSIYRKIGIIAPQDQAAAIERVLEERPYIDKERIGIWGWSGGGSMSLNAIFKFPEIYKTAISIAPVPNQRYYDTIYQERYMGLPSDNAQGYIDGSPINFAHQLEGNLLLIHGTADDNCHYQTMEMLISELILQNKQFEMMAYPNRTHSISEGKNTTRHLRELMTRYLETNL